MSSFNILEYTKNLVIIGHPDFTEEEVTTLANSLFEQAKKQVDQRERVRNIKAVQRGIDLTKTRVVSRGVYDWYMGLSNSEHQGEFGFKRFEMKSQQSEYKDAKTYRGLSTFISTEVKTKQFSYNKESPLRELRSQNRSNLFYEGQKSIKITKFPSKIGYDKENQHPPWTRCGYTSEREQLKNTGQKRKIEELHYPAIKRQRHGNGFYWRRW